MNFNPSNRFYNYLLLLGLMLFSVWANAKDQFAEQTLRAGFYTRAFQGFSTEDIEISVKLFSEELGKNANIQTSVTVFDDTALMRTAFEQGDINFVVASPLTLANDFDNSLFADGFRFIVAVEPPDSLVVLTRKNDGLDNLKSLRGQRLALVEHDPMADSYMDYLALSSFNKGYQASFKEIGRDKKAHLIILKLFFEQVDVICVYKNAYRLAVDLNPQLLSKIQIISQLNNIPQGLGLFHKNVSPAFRERVITEAIKLDTYARGQEFLQLFKSDKVVRASLADLAASKQLYSDYQKLKKTK